MTGILNRAPKPGVFPTLTEYNRGDKPMIKIMTLFFILLVLSACGNPDTPSPRGGTDPVTTADPGTAIVATVNGTPIPLSDFLFFLDHEMTSHEISLGSAIDWDGEAGGRPIRQYLKENALDILILGQTAEDKAAELGLLPTEAELADIEQSKRYEIDALGGRDAFDRRLRQYGLTEEAYTRHIYRAPVIFGKLYDHLFGADGLLIPNDEDVQAYFHNSFARALYAMRVTFGEDGAPLPADERDALRAWMADFDFDGDSGALSLLDDLGDMYFSPGFMEPEFDAALFSLKENETSGVVETSFALYIVKRLPLDDEFLRHNMETVRYACADARYTDLLGEWITQADVTLTAVYHALDPEQHYAKG